MTSAFILLEFARHIEIRLGEEEANHHLLSWVDRLIIAPSSLLHIAMTSTLILFRFVRHIEIRLGEEEANHHLLSWVDRLIVT